MDLQQKVLRNLEDYTVEGCHIRYSDLFGFSCQKWIVDDALEPRPTMFFSYDLTQSKSDRWSFMECDLVTSIFGSACFKPSERWILASGHSDVYFQGGGKSGEENPITSGRFKYISTLKCISRGYVYAAGSGRKVFKRQAEGKWKPIHASSMLPSEEDYGDAGFDDIDGYSDNEIYACGGAGDLWFFDGTKWAAIQLGTNARLKKICCASDGNVYITTNVNLLVIGRKDKWQIIDQDLDEIYLEEIVCYNDKVYISSFETLFEVIDNQVVETKLKLPKMDIYSHISQGDGVLLLAGSRCSFFYNGRKWTKVFDFT